jgi:bifunctional UDP-N-acetylglucosamine pyrophosphorylase/glucosamine-1-phosphate N-acetyltransferase
MKAVVLAAGKGEKLAPFSVTRPKSMIPIANVPICERIVMALKENGVEEVAFVIGPMGERIRNWLGDGSHLGVDITYLEQATPSGTASATALAKDFVGDEDFILVHGDLVFHPDALKAVIDDHLKNHTVCSVLSTRAGDPTHSFGASSDDSGKIKEIAWRPRDLDIQILGLYAFSNKAMQYILNNPGIMLSVPVGIMPPKEAELNESLSEMVQKGELVKLVETEQYVVDVDYPWDVIAANQFVVLDMSDRVKATKVEKGAYVSDKAKIHGPIYVGEGSRVEDGVHIEGPVWVGRNSEISRGAIVEGPSVIGDNSTLDAYCYVARSVIGNNVKIGHAAEVFGIIFDRVYIVHYSEIAGIVGENTDIGAATVVGTLRFDDEKTIVDVKGKKKVAENVAFVGDYCRTGVNAILMPGIRIGPYSIVGPGVILYDDLEPNKILLAKQELIKKDWGPSKYGW